MILYDIRCVDDHRFEGWFNSSTSYQEQHSAKLIECPICGTRDVERMLSAPYVVTNKAVAPQKKAPIKDDEMHQFMRKMRNYIEKNCENVGQEFPEMARKLHYGEAEPGEKGICGEASMDEIEELHDEGIQVAMLPWGRTDS